jgi:hypothetical protein
MSELTLETAHAVVDKGIEFNAWSWDDPSAATEEAVLSTAKILTDSATQASKKGSVADAVLEILHAANIAPEHNATRQAYAQRFNEEPAPNGTTPAPVSAEDASSMAKASATPTTEPQPTPTQEQAEEGKLDISSIFPGYDDYKVAQVKSAIIDSALSGDISPEEWEQIKAYEEANEGRKGILELEPEFKAPEPEPAPEPEYAPEAASPSSFNTADTPTPESMPVSRAQQENLPLPAPTDFGQSPPMLPIDITSTDDKELSRIATMFHSCFARAQWLLSQEEGRRDHAEHLEREAERDAYVRSYSEHQEAIPEEKKTQPTALEAARKAAERDAETAADVRRYRSAKVGHAIDARELKALAVGYDKAVWRINEELDRRARLQTNSHAS